jgi:transcriptional regulator with XRE-family HTH domain
MITKSEKPYLIHWANQFRKIRLQQNISQRKVFSDTGINIIRIESGNDNLTQLTFTNLCKYYNVQCILFQQGLPQINLNQTEI